MPPSNPTIRTRPGHCATHGDVTAQKTIPKLKFPFVIVFLLRRLVAAIGPYRCPTCGEKA